MAKREKTLVELRADIERLDREIAASVAKEDADAKQQGFTHKCEAWVHPASGDDRQVAFYQKGVITDADARAFLKRRRSQVLDDFKVTAL